MSMEKALALAALAKSGQGGGGGDVSFATDAEVKAGTATDKALAPSNESAASFYGLAKAAGDNTQAASSNPVGTYTAEAQTAIKSMLGVTSGGGETWELINTIEPTEEVATVSFTADANGNPFSLKKAILLGNVQKYEGTASLGTFCYAYVNNQKGMVYSAMSRPLTTHRTCFAYEIYAACDGLPYREVLKNTSVSGPADACGASNTNSLFDMYSINQDRQPTSISEVSVRTGNGEIVSYEGCKYFLYGVRA